jgi:hypothetical protein
MGAVTAPRAALLTALALVSTLVAVVAAPVAAVAPSSQGLYAIPYEPGTRVHVSRDHLTHSPEPDRIDMSGRSGGPYRVVAAAGGVVRFIQDSFTGSGSCAGNNYVWIQHPNGEWTKYGHVAQHSVTGDAGLTVGETVAVGQFLGIEDDVGCADGDHVHFEVAVPSNPADPINPVGGYIKGTNRVPRVCGIPNNLYVAGQDYVVPDVRPGAAEHAHHGMADSAYQADFDAARNCGYRLEWVDGFERAGQPYFNVVYRPAQGQTWASFRRLSGAQLDAQVTDYVNGRGYEVVHLDAYSVGTTVWYAVIFNRSTPLDTTSYHGLSASAHQARMDSLVAAGWRPRVISVASVGGVRTYAAVYALGSIGAWEARSFQTGAEYQANYDANRAAGRHLIYLNTYLHDGSPRFTAIWSSQVGRPVARHGMTSAEYRAEWQAQTSAGRLTRAVTAYSTGSNTWYAAYWRS